MLSHVTNPLLSLPSLPCFFFLFADPHMNGLLAESARQLAEALSALLNTAKGGHTAGKDCEDAIAVITASLNHLRVTQVDPKEFSG